LVGSLADQPDYSKSSSALSSPLKDLEASTLLRPAGGGLFRRSGAFVLLCGRPSSRPNASLMRARFNDTRLVREWEANQSIPPAAATPGPAPSMPRSNGQSLDDQRWRSCRSSIRFITPADFSDDRVPGRRLPRDRVLRDPWRPRVLHSRRKGVQKQPIGLL